MKLKLDEALPRDLATRLAKYRLDVHTVADEALTARDGQAGGVVGGRQQPSQRWTVDYADDRARRQQTYGGKSEHDRDGWRGRETTGHQLDDR